ncbi:zinc metalloprotease [Corynebacterium aurimucosum]|uniref:Zinc metalloprotease n=1 Tax=Corynebacterium aurimucosum TaxID=169292 RepID=A0A558GJC5_9CORY|nr:zinc metalloprotease [Corynebacterium aurimucosum]
MTSPHHAPEPQHESAPDDYPTAQFSAQPDSQPPTPAESSETGSKTDAGSIGLIVLVILAVIASLVMLISGSANALKIALLASLWAAVLGFFLVVRYRRQAHEAKELLAVERAHAASTLTASGASTTDSSQVLAEIRSELEAIRAQIEEISGREWVYEPAALYAEARRIQELERKAGGAGVDERGDAPNVNFTQKSGGAPSADAVAGRLGSQPTHPVSNPLDNLLADNARGNAQQPAAKPAEQPADQQGTRPAPSPFGAPQPSQNRAPAFRPMGEPQQKPQAPQPQPQPKAEKQQVKAEKQQARTEQKPQQQKPQTQSQPKAPEFKTDSFQAVQWNQGAAGAQHVKEDAGPAQPHHRHRKPESDSAQPSTRGRRRSDEHREGAVSVAELLARRKQQQEPDKDVKK